MWNIAESFDDQMIPITWYEGVQHEHSIHLQAGDDVALGVDGTHGMISKTLELCVLYGGSESIILTSI